MTERHWHWLVSLFYIFLSAGCSLRIWYVQNKYKNKKGVVYI